jgi:hypothetical protein
MIYGKKYPGEEGALSLPLNIGQKSGENVRIEREIESRQANRPQVNKVVY